jgi:tRNA pseudouridine38-40 synthase
LPNIRLVIEYDGSRFHGWQKQPNLRTVQSELERVIRCVLREDISALIAAGRTDAGVHAKGQVVNFFSKSEVDLDRLKHSVSSLLKKDLTVLSAEYVDENFNSCRDAICKQYRYVILNRKAPAVLDYGKVWYVPMFLDVERMKIEAQRLVGTHDFETFRGARCSARTSIKTIFSSEIEQNQHYIVYKVIGQGFLKQMVRNIVGTLVGFGRGIINYKSIEDLLAERDRKKAGMTAPGYALCLDWVRY